MRYFIFILLALPSVSKADDWFCTQGAQTIAGDSSTACGIGEARTEAGARSEALQEALQEFNSVCSVSDSCKNHKIVVTPQRTECGKLPGGYRCYRAIRVAILSQNKDPDLEIVELKHQVAEREREIEKQSELDSLKKERELLEDPSKPFWNLGGGLNISGSNFGGLDLTEINYGVSLKRCFGGVFCPGASFTLGKLALESVQVADVASAAGTVSVYVSKRTYFTGSLGVEYRKSKFLSQTVSFGTAVLGVEAVKTGTASLNLEGGLKGGPQVPVTPTLGATLGFKF